MTWVAAGSSGVVAAVGVWWFATGPFSRPLARGEVFASLAIVLGLFFVVAWFMRRSLPTSSRRLPSDVVETLGRAPLVGRQQMHVLRFGNKLLLVSVSPTGADKFDKDPSDITISIKAANFALGQAGRRWQVYLDGNLVTQVTDGSSTTTLKAVKKGDYALKVALATDDKTVVATAGLALSVGPEDQAPTTQPTTNRRTAQLTGSSW